MAAAAAGPGPGWTCRCAYLTVAVPGQPARSHDSDWAGPSPIRGRAAPNAPSGGKVREKLLAPSGTTTPNCAGACPGRLEEGTRHGLSDQRFGDRPQRAYRGDGQHLVVTARQAGGFLAWPGHARPRRHGLCRGDVNLGHARIAACRQQPGRRPGGGRATPRVPCRGRARPPGPGRPDHCPAPPGPPGGGPGPILPSARSAP
jgi:hypothetical protein